ncbi:hypothetical protein DB32_005753 [Sandaracinus amylolyticus]|uniref:Uncharacterized protein n=1 Tax=Sandaracinus amylolyticus TaxID=927083 RepID=A0A0F6SGF5_9BACT|nr:hypothetical protein DB32_005753 [Sandaracinus amylolyticus]
MLGAALLGAALLGAALLAPARVPWRAFVAGRARLAERASSSRCCDRTLPRSREWLVDASIDVCRATA